MTMSGKDRLLDSIDSGDKQAILDTLIELQSEVLVDEELALWIIAPVNITMLHKRLVEELGVNQRAMMLRHRVSNGKKRALMFLKAMTNGVSKVV